MAALKCNAAARSGFFLAALHSVAKRVSRGQAYHPSGLSPFARKTVPHASAATIHSSVPVAEPSRMSPKVEKIASLGVLVLLRLGVVHSFPSSGKWGRRPLASTRGPCGAGGRAFRGLTRSATEWSAARRKPLRAAAMPLRAANFADVKARRLPTSDRRKFPSGNFRSARDLEGAERVNPRKARPRPSPSPFARKRGMSPLLRFVGDVAEVDAERTQLAIQVRALHADALGELAHLAVTQQQLLL